MFAIRSGKWKYIDGAGSGGWSKGPIGSPAFAAQLYALEKDSGETNNLMDTHSNVAANLYDLLKQQPQIGYTRNGAKE